jgi:hypothetical protein
VVKYFNGEIEEVWGHDLPRQGPNETRLVLSVEEQSDGFVTALGLWNRRRSGRRSTPQTVVIPGSQLRAVAAALERIADAAEDAGVRPQA